MANPQPTDAHMRMAHSIEEEIMMRDFTKRQRSILDLILRLSWGCGKKTATIPHMCDFELTGIDRTKIKAELTWLVSANIIHWDRQTNTYSFNKDYDRWKISIVPGYDRKKFNELLHLNIDGCQNVNNVAEMATCQNGNIIDEKAIEQLTKKQYPQASNPIESDGFQPSKESIKESITITTASNEEVPETATMPNDSGRLPGAPDSDKESDRLPGASDESHAVEDIANHYFTVTGRLANSKDFVSITEVLDRPLAVPLGYKSKIKVIKQAMNRMAQKQATGKAANQIKSFSYFKDGIIDDFRKLEIAQTKGGNADVRNSEPSGGSTRAYGNGIIDYDQGFTNK